MFTKKAIASLFIVSALSAACGGGGGSGNGTTGETTGTGTTPTGTGTPAGSTTPTTPANPAGSATTPAQPPATGTATPTTPTTPGTPTTLPASDQRFNGYTDMVANQILYIRTNRIIYLPVHMSIFETNTGIVDIAAGSRVARIEGLEALAASQNCTRAIDGICGVQPSAIGPAAPLAAFGIRIEKALRPTTPGQQVANQTVVGRIAFDLTERSASAGVAAGQVPEIMRFVIDNVELTTDATGQLSSARVRSNSQIHVYGRNASNVEVRETVPAPQGSVRLLPLTDIPDGFGDNTSIILFMDLELAFSQAGQRLAALENIAGQFAMNVTFSSFGRIRRPAAPATVEHPAIGEKDLVGQPIVVNDQPPVTGAGISGNAWIRMYP